VPLESNGEDELDLVTVYRSMDADAKEDADCIQELLTDEGIQAVVLDDSAPGVPEGVFEVRVPSADAARAEELIAENPPSEEAEEVDDSPALDQETIASAASEMEALSIKNLLDSNGIAAVLVGDSVLPNFPFEVRVAHDQADRARLLIADAEKTGPAGAEEAERASESGS
jgi:Putative prokaryotic signal transducing protein